MPGGEGTAPHGRILVVDDQPDVADFLRSDLEVEGHVVVTAGNLDEVSTILAQDSQFDLAVVDVMLGRDSGYELTGELIARSGEYLPVLLVTAGTIDRERGKKGKGQRLENEPGASVAPGASPAESLGQGKGTHKGQRSENEPGASVAPGSSESFEQGKGKKNKGHVERGEQTPVPGGAINPQNPNANLEPQNNPEGGKHKGNRHDENQPGSQNVGGGAAGGGKRRQQIQSQAPPPQGGQYGQQGGQQGGQGKGKSKEKKGETSPTPSPR